MRRRRGRPSLRRMAISDLDQMEQGARATWAAGDYHAIAERSTVAGGRARRPQGRGRGGRRRARRRLRDRQRGAPGGRGRRARGRRRPGARAVRDRPATGRRGRGRDRVGVEGDAEALPAGDESSRCRGLGVRLHVRASPPRRGRRARARAAPRRPPLRGGVDARRERSESCSPRSATVTCRHRRRSPSRRCCGARRTSARDLFADSGLELEFSRETVQFPRFDTVEEEVEFSATKFGPMIMARRMLPPERWEALGGGHAPPHRGADRGDGVPRDHRTQGVRWRRCLSCTSATSARSSTARASRCRSASATRVQDGELPDVLLLLEHPPVYTRGRRSEPGELPMGEAWYRSQGIDVVQTDRGGKLTYHGPGQLVGYPIVPRRPTSSRYLRTMEEAIVAALAEEGIEAGRARGAHRRLGGGPQDRLDRRPRLARRDHPRLRDQRRQRPPAVRVGRAVRARRRAHDVDHDGAGAGDARRLRSRAPRCALASSASARAAAGSGWSTARARSQPRQ